MEFEKLIRERYSVRKFRPEHLKRDDLDAILNAGRVAPTAVNGQPQRILVINTDEACEKLKDCEASQNHAPCALLVCCDETKCWVRKFDGKKSGEIDASIVATHMMLAAEDIGVGCVWVMVFDPEKTKKAYN
ncbi:MAG: nitroreductase family protein, partial [Clostridia bacterium]|nr:nitroreductase family protein [Clostridia bacterium]